MGKFADMQRMGKPLEEKVQRVEANKLKELHCEHCDSIYFESVNIFKILPAEMALDGKQRSNNILVIRCADCKKLDKKGQEDLEEMLYKEPNV